MRFGRSLPHFKSGARRVPDCGRTRFAVLARTGEHAAAQLYATTFYPSAIDEQGALLVSASTSVASSVPITLVPVRGARISGTVLSSSGRPTREMRVTLFHQFGGFDSGSVVAVVGADGRFETRRVPPGRYRLRIARPSDARGGVVEFADRVIDVQTDDIGGLSLVAGPGASIDGRVVAEPGSDLDTPIGLTATAAPGAMSGEPVYATVAGDWTFHMTGLSNSYRFVVGNDRKPFVVSKHVSVDGVDAPAATPVELVEGTHQVVIYVARAPTPRPTIDETASTQALVQQFKSDTVFWRQLAVAKAIVARHDASVLPALQDWLHHDDRHIRGNTAFVFAGLGDPRGLRAIVGILTDRSDRPRDQGIPTPPSDGRYRVERQIRSDRYYAAHLLGVLRDPRAVPILVPLLKDPEVQSTVPWSLAQIGDARAVAPLIDALADDDPSMRVLVIYALEELHAREAIPRLTALLSDHRKARFGSLVPVAAAARAAIARLQ